MDALIKPQEVIESNWTEAQARKFVGQLYQAVLDRDADEDGLNFYVSLIMGGKTPATIVREFINSEEHLEKWVPKLRSRIFETFDRESKFPIDYSPPGESGRCYARRVRSGFYDRFCGGDVILDVGFSGYDNSDSKTAVPGAIGVDLDYPGYDGITLPFSDGSVDTVMSSHCLEHTQFDLAAIRDWFRVLKVGGHIICMVPHQGLYEKKRFLPSHWNADHKRMYTPALLLESFEKALEINSYRVRHLADNDAGFDYSIGPDAHSSGAYEIELVIEKISPPSWSLA